MIRSTEEYLLYLEADRRALNRRSKSLKALIVDDIWRFERVMRRLEYCRNCQKLRLMQVLTKAHLRSLGRRLGFSIPINVFGPGLSLSHRGTIVVDGNARIGANCRLHVCVNIGVAAGTSNASPTIGNNCYIGPGAKIYGPIILGDNIAIGANAVVNQSFPEGNVTLAGVPARIVSKKGSEGLLTQGWEGDYSSSPMKRVLQEQAALLK